MKLAALVEDFPPETDASIWQTARYFWMAPLQRPSRRLFAAAYRWPTIPMRPRRPRWLAFLDGLLYPEDIPTLQEYIGYCLIPSNKGQRMMVIKATAARVKVKLAWCWLPYSATI